MAMATATAAVSVLVTSCAGAERRRAVAGRSSRQTRGAAVIARSDDTSADNNGTQEALEERLKRAEAEAAALRAQLNTSAPASDTPAAAAVPTPKRPPGPRVDGAGMRETIFDLTSGASRKKKSQLGDLMGSGLSEAELFLSKGVASGETIATNDVDQGLVRRYALVSFLSTASAIGLSFVRWTPKPPKPIGSYLLPLVRVQTLLPAVAEYAAEGEWDRLDESLRALGARGGTGLSLRDNLINAASCLPNISDVDVAKEKAFNVLEFVAQADYKQYYDSLGGPPQGKEAGKAADFSASAINAANRELKEFLKLMPPAEVAAAKEALAAQGAQGGEDA